MTGFHVSSWTLIVFMFDWIVKITAEYCLQNGHSCSSPYRCCDSTCCLPDGYEERDKFHLRWSIWNMWYFWFFVIFILMICFGGCGYWRRRQILIAQQQAIMQARSMGIGHIRSHRVGSHSPLPLPVYPGISRYPLEPECIAEPQGNFPSPPPYAEIFKEEEGRPKNDKDLLPPYPGRPGVSSDEVLANEGARSHEEDPSSNTNLPPYSQIGIGAPPPYFTPPLLRSMPETYINNNNLTSFASDNQTEAYSASESTDHTSPVRTNSSVTTTIV